MLSTTTPYMTTPILQFGSKGAEVVALQQRLNLEFGQNQQIIVNGVFGSSTEHAVKIIQQRFFLAQDGVVGMKTRHVLATRSLLEAPLLRRGCRGALVARIQQVLKAGGFYQGKIDGDFGSRTQYAVKTFQAEWYLLTDGVVGYSTWQALMELVNLITAKANPNEPQGVAFFAFEYQQCEQPFIFKLTNPQRIEQARDILSGKNSDVKCVMGKIIKQAVDYNPAWSFHLDPDSIRFFGVAVEFCDASIQYVEDHLEEVGRSFLPSDRWCPHSSRLVKEIPPETVNSWHSLITPTMNILSFDRG